eukprot:1136917-Pelagomonas_calceolata.AAC.7
MMTHQMIAMQSQASRTGNECVDQVAKYQASLKHGNLTDTGIPSAGPGGIHSTIHYGWLGKRQILGHLNPTLLLLV